jgi:hypothetical protein
MTSVLPDNLTWYQQNREVLRVALERILTLLEYFQEQQQILFLEPIDWPLNSSIDALQNKFHLSNFELDILLLCVGCELNPRIAQLCGKLRGNPNLNVPSLMLALGVLPESDVSVISPDRPLLRWQLIRPESHLILTEASLKLNHRILCYLLGEHPIDPALQGIVRPIENPEPLILAASHQVMVAEILQFWLTQDTLSELPVLQLCSSDVQTVYQIAGAIAAEAELDLKALSAQNLPQDITELHQLQLLWERESLLGERILFIDAYNLSAESSRHQALKHWIESIKTPLIIGSEDRYSSQRRTLITYPIAPLSYEERKQLWQHHLGDLAPQLNGQLERLAGQFYVNVNTIQAATQQVLHAAKTEPEHLSQTLWNICRLQARPRLEELAQFIEPRATWEDLVLPEGLQSMLQEMAAHLRQRVKVQEEWGFRAKNSRGLGLSALFAGGSGTGKTMAAEVLGHELKLDIFRIDLSAVTSKYIGETEKNLQRIFDAAEVGGTILLFDEADALFGKRTEVKDSRDRYANIEVSYLLQRMEAYQGLAILTTNLKDSIDQAFLRRIPFVLNFPFPNKEARAEIWRRVFPEKTPTDGLNIERLAQLNVTGGNIRSIALNAAVLAADAGEAVRMEHIFSATQTEYIKLGALLTSSETRGWFKTS